MLVSTFLIERLENCGVKTVFGFPGNNIANFYKELSQRLNVVTNVDSSFSGFAADAYARIKGIGCVVANYNVGASKLINAVQCAYVERSPIVVISGAPAVSEKNLISQSSSPKSQYDIFKNITCACEILDKPSRAGFQIDAAFEKMRQYKRPIYLELPRDIAMKPISYDVFDQGTPISEESDLENLQEAVKEICDWLQSAKRPAILAGLEIARCGLGEALANFSKEHNIPIATTLLSKSVVDEQSDLFAGIYAGAASKESVRNIIEDSDCLLMLGVMLNDFALCFKPERFDKRQIVLANLDGLKVRNHSFKQVEFLDLCKGIFESKIDKKEGDFNFCNKKQIIFEAKPVKVTTDRLFQKIDSILTKEMIVVADVGDSLFGAAELTIRHTNYFLSPAFYASIGFAIPGALAVKLALPNVRPIVILGDGSFRMSFQEIATMVRLKQNPIIFVLNNGGFSTNKHICNEKFNTFDDWNYHKVGEIFGGNGELVETEEDLEKSIKNALDSKEPFVINVKLQDFSQGFIRMVKVNG